jgi:putative restriction endonuclease|tara:strand:- start:155 stop:412 length:258 start_codon:yes stop_codon:yes gene_type:complete
MIRYFTKKDLIRINNNSIKHKRNRTLEPSHLKSLPDNKLFPIGLAFEHNGVEMRVMVVFNQSGAGGYLDLSFNEFNKLSQMKGVN